MLRHWWLHANRYWYTIYEHINKKLLTEAVLLEWRESYPPSPAIVCTPPSACSSILQAGCPGSATQTTSLAFRLLMGTFGRVASSFEFCQCVLLVEVKVSTLKAQFVSLSLHCGNTENTFQHLWTNIFLKIFCQPNLRPLLAFSA